MAKSRSKEKRMSKPVEHHDTAAWSDIHGMKRISKVNLPDEFHIRDAKEYVDSNQK